MGTKHREIIDASLHRFGVWSDVDPVTTYGLYDPEIPAAGGVQAGLTWIQHAAAAPNTITAIKIRNATNAGWIDLASLFSPPLTLDDEVASFTLALTHAGVMVTVTNAGAVTLTVPTNAAVAFPVGTSILIEQGGAGQVTIAGDVGVTVNSAGAKLKLSAQYSVASIVKKATDTWTAFGDLAS